MKIVLRPLFLSFILVVVAANGSFCAQRDAYLKSMIGSVKVRKGESPIWKDGRQQMLLREKDAVRTFVESQAEVMTAEGSVMKLDENTTLELSTLKDFGGGTQSTSIKILNGTVLANVKKLVNTGSSFEFETPTAVASIRGTILGINVAGDQTSIKVYDGEVMVKPRGGSAAVSVKSNQMVTVVKGQKTVTPETISEKDKNVIVPPQDTARKDTTNKAVPPPDTGAKKVGAATDTTASRPAKPVDTTEHGSIRPKSDTSAAAAASAQLFLHVTSPSDGEKFGAPVIPVTGMTTPGAEVSVSGIKCQVSPNGAFSGRIPIPDEENQLSLEFEAVLGGQTQQVVRKIMYQPDLTMLITSPEPGQILTSTSIQVAGQILPSTAELIVYDTKIPISTNGKFMGYVTIPDEEGQITLNFDVSYQGTVRSDSRTITYKKAVDKIAPVVQPSSMPAIYQTGSMSFTVFDQTPDDEVTFYKITDGSRESESGKPNSSFTLSLLEGMHTYTVYAEDLAKNRSSQVTGTVTYLSQSFAIKMRKPLGTDIVHIPPSSPAGAFTPQYSVQFTILNVPDDDRRLIKQVSVTNLATHKIVTQKNILDLDMEFDVELLRGNNPLSVDILDVLDRPFSEKNLMVIVR
jgi:FecR protein/Glucodextranase, domain B